MKQEILIYAIDDSEFQLKVLEKGFLNYKSEYFNFSIRTFLNFFDFQSALLEKVPNCFIVDLVMPYVSGISVLNFLEKFYKDTPKFINSSCNGEEYKIMAEYRYHILFLDKESDMKSRIDIISKYLLEKVITC